MHGSTHPNQGSAISLLTLTDNTIIHTQYGSWLFTGKNIGMSVVDHRNFHTPQDGKYNPY